MLETVRVTRLIVWPSAVGTCRYRCGYRCPAGCDFECKHTCTCRAMCGHPRRERRRDKTRGDGAAKAMRNGKTGGVVYRRGFGAYI